MCILSIQKKQPVYTTKSGYAGCFCVKRAYYGWFPCMLPEEFIGIIISYKFVKAMCYSHDSHILIYHNYFMKRGYAIMKTIRIGGGQGFWGDLSDAPITLSLIHI